MYAIIMGNYVMAGLPINYIEKPKLFSFLYLLQITSKYIYVSIYRESFVSLLVFSSINPKATNNVHKTENKRRF